MSALVALPFALYEKTTFNDFKSTQGASTANALPMAWASQLAYDVDDPDKINAVFNQWGLTLMANLHERNTSGLLQIATRAFIATGHNAIIVAFQGTDPLVLASVASDLNVALNADNLHSGFASALDSVWPDIATQVANLPEGKAIFITGHSLGGALAVLAADRMYRELNKRAAGVFAFGMPRAGGAAFLARYKRAGLADVTLRLVYGEDIIPTLPPSNSYVHVGKRWTAPRGQRFDATNTMVEDDLPTAGQRATTWVKSLLQAPQEATNAGPPPGTTVPRSDPAGIIINALPGNLRDHMPDCYWAALS